MPRFRAPTTIVLRFIELINAHDVDGLVDLLASDHRFVDSLGGVFEGRETLRNGWRSYLRMVPDYSIEVERIIADGSDVVVLGTARGTYSRDGIQRLGDPWATPGAWMGRVKRGHITEWRVYADNEPIRRRMREVTG
jgi:ketosteroid isomerase-like protein